MNELLWKRMMEQQPDQSMVSKGDETPRSPRTFIPQFNIAPPAPPGPQALIRPASMSSTNSSAISQLVSDPDITDAGNWSSESSPEQQPPAGDPNWQEEQVTNTTMPTLPPAEPSPPQEAEAKAESEPEPEPQPASWLEIPVDLLEQEAVRSSGECEDDRESEASTVRWGDAPAENCERESQRSIQPADHVADEVTLKDEEADAPVANTAPEPEHEDDEEFDEDQDNEAQLRNGQQEAEEAEEAGLTARERLELRLERNKQARAAEAEPQMDADGDSAEIQET